MLNAAQPLGLRTTWDPSRDSGWHQWRFTRM